jgi:hypothetical protein
MSKYEIRQWTRAIDQIGHDHDPGVEQCKQHLERSPKELFFANIP